MSANKTPRILICRLSHIGDCVLTLPMLSALREAMPAAYIAWAVEQPTPQLLANHPDLDEIITIPKSWLQSASTILQVRRDLRSYQFDVALDPQSICKSSMLAYVSGAARRYGLAGRQGRELSKWFNNCLVDVTSTHLVDRSLQLLGGLGVAHSIVRFKIPISNKSIRQMDWFLREQQINDRFVAINPGASWPSKRWEADRFAQLARRINQRLGLTSVITWAGDEELAMADQIVGESAEAAIHAPQTNLQQLIALLYRSSLFVGCDTGPLHMASAVGTTCVGLYGPTRPQDSGAYGPQHYAVQKCYQSGSCRQRRKAENLAMRDISVDDVFDTVCCALQKSPKTAAQVA